LSNVFLKITFTTVRTVIQFPRKLGTGAVTKSKLKFNPHIEVINVLTRISHIVRTILVT
jgi:hypothetical protein